MSSNKLQNIKAIKQLVDGTHRMQTRTTIGGRSAQKAQFELDKKMLKPGQCLVESTSDLQTNRTFYKTWIKVPVDGGGGYLISVNGKYDTYEQYLQHKQNLQYDPFFMCDSTNETCNKSKPSRIDYKIASKGGKCLDCLQKEEAQQKYKGGDAYRKWVYDKMRANAEAYLKDQELQLQEALKQLDKTDYGVNADGRVIEKMSISQEDKDKLKQRLIQEFDEYKKWVLGQQQED